MRIRNRLLNIYYDYISYGSDETVRNTRLFTLEGMLLTAIIHLANGNFAFYAIRLNASDFQLSLVSSLPPLIGMIFLIPGAILTDKFKTKKNIVKIMPLFYGFFYFLIAFAPLFKEKAIIYFLSLLLLASIPYHIYNSSWQAYFYDIIPTEKRNYSFTLRTMCTFIISSSLPLITGQILVKSTADKKLAVHQVFLFLCLVAGIMQFLIVSKTGSGEILQNKIKTSFKIYKILEIFKNKKFILFLLPMLLFHMSWHIDWSINFIAQTRYYGANEAWLSYIIVGGNIMQFIFVRIWSGINRRKGVRFTLVFGAGGYAMYALFSVFNLIVPESIALWFNLGSYLVTNAFWIAFTLCGLQALLEVVPKESSTLCISIYNIFILLSNCTMPIAGVKIYTLLGGDKPAMLKTFIFVFIFRFIGTLLLYIRYIVLKGRSVAVQTG